LARFEFRNTITVLKSLEQYLSLKLLRIGKNSRFIPPTPELRIPCFGSHEAFGLKSLALEESICDLPKSVNTSICNLQILYWFTI
jgi:hypothetical protein